MTGVEDYRALVFVVFVSAAKDNRVGTHVLAAADAGLRRSMNSCGSQVSTIGIQAAGLVPRM